VLPKVRELDDPIRVPQTPKCVRTWLRQRFGALMPKVGRHCNELALFDLRIAEVVRASQNGPSRIIGEQFTIADVSREHGLGGMPRLLSYLPW
jgi:hypothetical protein